MAGLIDFLINRYTKPPEQIGRGGQPAAPQAAPPDNYAMWMEHIAGLNKNIAEMGDSPAADILRQRRDKILEAIQGPVPTPVPRPQAADDTYMPLIRPR